MRGLKWHLDRGQREGNMPTVSKLRRTYFAVLKELPGAEHLDRHDLQESLTGKSSTKDWTKEDWETAIAALQYELGQVDSPDAPARVREDRPHGLSVESGTWATRAQARFVGDLEREIEWGELKRGPLEFLRTTILKAPEKCLRRARIQELEIEAASRHTTLSLGEAARWLTRREAGALIDALKSLRKGHPARCAAS